MAGITIPLITEFKDKGIKQAMKEFKALETTGKKAQFALKKAALPAIAALGALAVAAGKALSAGEAVSTANARILQINKSMGLFGASSQKSCHGPPHQTCRRNSDANRYGQPEH
jgi:hypothetical protein